MQKRKVISGKNLPQYVPINGTAITYLFLDKFHAAGWIWGALGFFWVVIWVAIIVIRFSEKDVDVFEESESPWSDKFKFVNTKK